MTDSNSLRGDPNYDPARRYDPELRELNTLRALLRPRIIEVGEQNSTDALRGLIVELTAVYEQVRLLDEQVAKERKLANAAAQGHDYARMLLLATAEVFGCRDDLDSLPAKVRKLDADWRAPMAKAVRWTKICEAFGFDPEQDPPVSIPAVLVGEIWADARRMLADACKRAPSLEVVLGGLVQGLSEARQAAGAMSHGQTVCTGCARRIAQGEARQPVQGCGDCWWLEFGNAPLAGFRWADPEPCATALLATTQAPIEASLQEELEAVRFALDETAGWARTRRTALRILGWDETADPETWATARAADFDSFLTTVRAALDIPTSKPLLPYLRHAATGMKALAILGWQDGHPVEWATARAAAEADLRGAFAEAELVGSDYAAMVRQMWGNLRSKAEQATSALAQLKHLSSTVDLAEKRLLTWRSWVIGMCPATPAFSSPMDNMSDDGLRAAMNYVPASALDSAQGKLKAALDGLNRAIALLSQ